MIYPGAHTAQFSVYDGTLVQCQSSAAVRVITLNSSPRPVTLQVSGAEPQAVTLNGASLKKRATPAEFDVQATGWRFDVAAKFIFIKFSHAGGTAEVRC